MAFVSPRAVFLPRFLRSYFTAVTSPSSFLANGILDGDLYLKNGIPNSRFSLVKESVDLTLENTLQRVISPYSSFDPFKAVEDDLRSVGETLKELVGSDHPVLNLAARHFFDVPGKRVRPTIVLLVSRALNSHVTNSDLNFAAQKRLSEITEMIHTASLLHDDVIDEAETRRGVQSVNAKYGNKLAILGGDFLLARASVGLAKLQNPHVILLMSTIIEHLVKGEVMQMASVAQFGLKETIDYYVTKSFYKTASLLAHSCRSTAILGGHNDSLQEIAYDFGTHLGLAFQVVDDLLDVQESSESLGKPAGNDLACGLATAPVLYAAEEYPQLKKMIANKFRGENEVKDALTFISKSQGFTRSRALAVFHASQAAAALQQLPDSNAKSCLFALIGKILNRRK